MSLFEKPVALNRINAHTSELLIKTLQIEGFPAISFDFYEDGFWGINAPHIHMNCPPKNGESLRDVLLWGDVVISVSESNGLYFNAPKIYIGHEKLPLTSTDSDIQFIVEDVCRG